MSDIKVGSQYKFRPCPDSIFTVVTRTNISSTWMFTLSEPKSKHHLIMSEEVLRMLGTKVEEPEFKITIGQKYRFPQWPHLVFEVIYQRGDVYGLHAEPGKTLEFNNMQLEALKGQLISEDYGSNLKQELQGLLGLQPGMSIVEAVKELKQYKLCIENVRKEIERAAPKLG